MKKAAGARPFSPIFPDLLLHCPGAALRDHIVLRAGAAGHADGTDDLPVYDDGIAAARGYHVIERRQVVEEGTLAEQAFEHHRRAPIASGRAGLVLRD